jgi:hypothetical protein
MDKQLKLFGICLGTYSQKRTSFINESLFILFYNFKINDSILYGKVNTENIMFVTKEKLSEDEIKTLKKQWKEEQEKNNNRVVLLSNNEVTYRYNHINEHQFFMAEYIRQGLIDNKQNRCILEIEFKDIHNFIIISLLDQITKKYIFKSQLEIIPKSLELFFE